MHDHDTLICPLSSAVLHTLNVLFQMEPKELGQVLKWYHTLCNSGNVHQLVFVMAGCPKKGSVHEYSHNADCSSRQISFSLCVDKALLRGTEVMPSLGCVVSVWENPRTQQYGLT